MVELINGNWKACNPEASVLEEFMAYGHIAITTIVDRLGRSAISLNNYAKCMAPSWSSKKQDLPDQCFLCFVREKCRESVCSPVAPPKIRAICQVESSSESRPDSLPRRREGE